MANGNRHQSRRLAEWRAREEEHGPGWAETTIDVVLRSTRLWIYGLEDPRTHTLHWIGQTVDLDDRLRLHVLEARYPALGGYDSAKSLWVRDIFSARLHPLVCGFEEVAYRVASEVENAYIACALGLGCPLFNQQVPASFKTGLSEAHEARIRARIEQFISY